MPAQEPVVGTDLRGDGRSPSMRELLAACAAASAVSTPPAEEAGRAGERQTPEPDEPARERRDAA
ncbi:hypothetical protein HUT19_16870 [Streptomyces sp. NA02950]|uniref:hypothetical protein n=1 Tax=Streptomyces sp. NA02950 TaxID=2742137 RepID=UPI001591E76A|nr:hypothetical protein [Streptomyces sp. NA02950]QKV93223.1 hypothetical protein HUT19_16870 [Streptomyces sp. NA02950]